MDDGAAGLPEPGQRRVRGAHAGHQVDVEARAPAGFVVAVPESGRVVDQDIDAAESLGGTLDPVDDGTGVGEVAGAGVDGAAEVAQFGLGLAQALQAARADGDVGTGGGKAQRDGASDPAAGAGNKNLSLVERNMHACVLRT